MTTGYVYSDLFLRHQAPGHPETPLRLESIQEVLEAGHLLSRLKRIDPAPASEAQVLAVHSLLLVERLKGMVRRGGGYLDSDTYTNAASLDTAVLSAGAAIRAVDAVMAQEVDNAFVAARPPGHHAMRDQSMGFCLMNNVAIATQHAIDRYRLERVMIIDLDVHHGNGTQDIFYTRPDVLYFSTHRYPFYPGTGHWSETGEARGEGYTVNVPLPQGVGNQTYAHVFDDILYPVAERYHPQLVLVSAGYDAHWADPLGAQTLLSAGGYAYLVEVIQNLAHDFAGGRVVYLLEGGYHLEAVADSVAATLRVMLGDRDVLDPLGASPRLERDFRDLVAQLRTFHRVA